MSQLLPDNQSSQNSALRILADKPIRYDSSDQLGFSAYADALAELIDHPDTDTPLTIAISAEWGAGKTSLARMVERRLITRPRARRDPSHITCWFNAWMHDDAPHLGAAFAAEVAKTANRNRPTWRRVLKPIASAMLSSEERWRRHVLLAVFSLAAALIALSVAFMTTDGRVLQSVRTPQTSLLTDLLGLFGYGQLSIFVFLLIVFALTRRLFSVAQSAAKFVDDPKSEAAKGSMQEVAHQLGQLILEATHVRRRWFVIPRRRRRFVIFVDDLERCRPPRAIEVCEVASQLLGHNGVVTVLVADMSTIAASAQIKYAALEGAPSHTPYGRSYLQKIVQLQFNLPMVPAESIRGVLWETGPSVDEEGMKRRRKRIRRTVVPLLGLLAAGLLVFGVIRSRSGDQLSSWIFYPIAAITLQGIIAVILSNTATRDTETKDAETEERRTSIGWIIVSLMALADVGLAAFVVTRAITGPFGILSLPWVPYFIGANVLLFGAVFFVIFISDFQSYLAERARRQVDDEIRKAIREGLSDAQKISDMVLRSGVVSKRYEPLIPQRVQRLLADESSQRRQAEAEIYQYLPPLPRSAKRVLNQLRVLLVVAEGRRMLGGTVNLEPKHIGKWAVLLEQWPELGSILSSRPSEMRNLERAKSMEELANVIRPHLSDFRVTEDLLGFLTSGIQLTPVVERLVSFQPADQAG